MGSSGGRRSGEARGGSADRISDCENVSIEALLASQQPAALAQAKQGDVVQITLDTSTGRNLVEVRLRGTLLGTLTVNGLDKLIECLRQGLPFHGTVREIEGALCRILVRSGALPS